MQQRSLRASWSDGRSDNRKDRTYRAARAELVQLVAQLNQVDVYPGRVIACRARVVELTKVIDEYEVGIDRAIEAQRADELKAELARREQRLRESEIAYWQRAREFRELREQLVNQ